MNDTWEWLTWFACSHPERPTDPYVVWHYQDCAACRVKAQALLRQFPDSRDVRSLVEYMAHRRDC